MTNHVAGLEVTIPLESQLDNLLKNFQTEAGFSGVLLLANRDKKLYCKGIGMADQEAHIANTPQTRFRIASITKQFTAAAILLLQEAGKLTVQDPVHHHLVNSPAPWEPITVHHLLSHTSGIINLQDMPIYGELSRKKLSTHETLKAFIDEPLNFAPGRQFSYSNSGYVVLGLIIEQISGQPYDKFLQENIFDPLGMCDSGYDHNRDDIARGYSGTQPADFIDMSLPYAAGGLYANIEDLYKWDQALYTDQLLTAESRIAMFTKHASMPAPPPETSYGYGTLVSRGFAPGKLVVGHDGGIRGFASLILRFIEEKTTLIILSNQEEAPTFEIAQSVIGHYLSAKKRDE